VQQPTPAPTAEYPPLSKLADLLAARGIKRRWLAGRLGISDAQLSLLMAGKRNPTDYLDRIAHVLAVPLWTVTPDREDAA
jgi:DNA-binding Xre family transcriptional regulator